MLQIYKEYLNKPIGHDWQSNLTSYHIAKKQQPKFKKLYEPVVNMMSGNDATKNLNEKKWIMSVTPYLRTQVQDRTAIFGFRYRP